jgi:hypothetical protein
MKRYKFVVLLAIAVSATFFAACSDSVLESEEKSASIVEELSIIQTKVQFGIDRIYHYKIAVESNYLPTDSLTVLAYFTNGVININLPLYDDGVSDSLYRNDLVASNNIWSGGINSNDFPNEGDWELNIEVFILDSTLISDHIFTNILVNSNTAPQINSITGIVEADTLESGFDTRNLTISITDPDNDAIGYNDNQTLKLEIWNRDNSKDSVFVREDPLGNMVISLDSTLASGLVTNDNYLFIFTATDYYGESDIDTIKSVRIENIEPIIYNLQYPDTVFVPADNTIFIDFNVTVNVNDPQGYIADIDSVNITTNSTRQMRDDGEGLDEFENDGIYTMSYSINSSFFPEDTAELPFTIEAIDKVYNKSNQLSGTLIFIKDTKSKTNRENDVQKFNYSNPFNTK